MDYRRTLPEPQAPPPLPQTADDHLHLSALPTQYQHYADPLYHHQQPLSYSTYPTNPSFSYSHYESNPIQSPHGAKDPYSTHGGYVSAAYPYAGAVASVVPVAGAIDGVYCYGGEDSRTIAAKDAIRQYGAHPLGYVEAPPRANVDALTTTVPPYLNPPYQNIILQPNSKKAKKTVFPKITKVVQSAYCGVCKVDCNSQDVLKSHKQGKKHKKNLHKLQESITPKPKKAQRSAPAGSPATASDDKEKPFDETKRKNTTILEAEVDLETKKIRVLEAGASAYEVRVCTICNVVVNSQKVYEYHLAGQKHAAMLEKFQEAGVS